MYICPLYIRTSNKFNTVTGCANTLIKEADYGGNNLGRKGEKQ